MRRLVVACEHPDLHTGFATVGRAVAHGLRATGEWAVEFLPLSTDEPPDVSVITANPPAPGDGQSRALLCIGSPRQQSRLLDALEAKRLRHQVHVVSYLAVDHAPVSPLFGRLHDRFDTIVPYTRFAAAALRHAFPGISPRLAEPIPHGIDVSLFAAPDAAERRATRMRVFGVADDQTMVIGFFGRNVSHKHPELALRIFSAFVQGLFGRCPHCRRVTPFDRDPIDGTARVHGSCALCGKAGLSRVDVPDSRLYLHTESGAAHAGHRNGLWNLDRLARHLNIRSHVVFDRTLRPGAGVEAAELARRMGACDIHLLPSDAGGWELTVLETAACGVPNVITDVGGAPEYARPFSEVVAPSVRTLQPDRSHAYMDIGGALDALLRLTGDPDRRTALGRIAVETAQRYRWSNIIPLWDRVLRHPLPGTAAIPG